MGDIRGLIERVSEGRSGETYFQAVYIFRLRDAPCAYTAFLSSLPNTVLLELVTALRTLAQARNSTTRTTGSLW